MNSAECRRRIWMVIPLLVGACAAPAVPPAAPSATREPTPPPSVTAAPTTSSRAAVVAPGAQWNYVALGDSSAMAFPTHYARMMEEDLGISVKVIKWVRSGMTSAEVLYQLREDAQEREDVHQAQVVTFYGNPLGIIGLRITSGLASDAYDCSPEAIALYRSQMAAIADEILALRRGQPTLIRTYLRFMPFYRIWRETGQFDEYQRCVAALDAAVLEVGRERGIGVADCATALNGPKRDQDPNDRNLLEDGIHENSQGAEIVAEAFRRLGYETIVP
jgi:hypothetical protein